MLRIRRASLCALAVMGLLVAATACTRVTAPLEPPMTVRRGDEAFRYQDYAGGLEARASDAGILARRAFDAGATTRSDMIKQLRALGEVDGATGALRVTLSGLQRSVFLLRVYEGTLEEIGAAG